MHLNDCDKARLKESVTGRMIVEAFRPDLRIRHGRIQCPIHGGDHYNLALYRNGYHCFVCCCSGDVIQLTMHLTGCDFVSSVTGINDTFGLGLDLSGPRTMAEKRRLSERERELARIAAERKQTEELERRVFDALDTEYITLDAALRQEEDPFRAAILREKIMINTAKTNAITALKWEATHDE